MTIDTLQVLSASGSFLAGTATLTGLFVAWRVHSSQKKLSQRQLIIPLWEHLTNLKNIDSEEPIIPDVINTVNTLELVALCYEGGMVDKAVIKRTFAQEFIRHYDSIDGCKKMNGLDKTGKMILQENVSAMNLYSILMKEKIQSGELK